MATFKQMLETHINQVHASSVADLNAHLRGSSPKYIPYVAPIDEPTYYTAKHIQPPEILCKYYPHMAHVDDSYVSEASADWKSKYESLYGEKLVNNEEHSLTGDKGKVRVGDQLRALTTGTMKGDYYRHMIGSQQKGEVYANCDNISFKAGEFVTFLHFNAARATDSKQHTLYTPYFIIPE
jgi:hypothetical protein